MKFKAILFDMDGTIIDTESVWHKATLIILQSRSIHISNNEFERVQNDMHGLTTFDRCTYLKLEFNLDDTIEELMQKKNTIAQALFDQEVRFIEGFIAFHKQVCAHNLKTAIATNADDATITSTDKALNFRKYFGTHIYGVSCVKQGKPDPAIYLYAAEQLQTDPQDCIVIEDSKHGIAAAKKAAMYCVGINTAKKVEYLEAADHKIDHYNQLDLSRILEKKS